MRYKRKMGKKTPKGKRGRKQEGYMGDKGEMGMGEGKYLGYRGKKAEMGYLEEVGEGECWGYMGDMGEGKVGDNISHAGYEYLLAYKITVSIYDYTIVFCNRYIDRKSRTRDQMVQAARSGMANIVEGNRQESLSGYIKLTGVARGSLEELIKDYYAYGRQMEMRIWDRREIRETRESREIWRILASTPTLPTSPRFPSCPSNPELFVNLLIHLNHQAIYLLDRLIASLEEKHMKEGGFRENLMKKRIEYRKMETIHTGYEGKKG